MLHLEMFPATAGTAHNLKELDKRPDTPIAVNPKTRPPPICLDKKNQKEMPPQAPPGKKSAEK